MSTRSRIGILHADLSATTIYCHSDGYYSQVGRKLWEHYRDGAGVETMLGLGDMSVLGAIIGKKHDFDWMMKVDADKWNDDPRHRYCRFYKRDRGEQDLPATRSKTVEEIPFEEYCYLFDEVTKEWICAATGYYSEEVLVWRRLADVMAVYDTILNEGSSNYLGEEGIPSETPAITLRAPVLTPEEQNRALAAEALAVF